MEKEELTLLVFKAPWCGPCKTLSPILTEVLEDFNNINLTTIDIDVDTESAVKHNVRAVPTLILLKGEEEVGRLIGSVPANKLKQFLENT